jgi:hypothetical protein
MQLLVNIDVADLDSGIDFYCSALALRAGRRLFGGTVVELLGASLPIYLLAKPAESSASLLAWLPRDYRWHWTLVHLDFVVDEVESAVQRALAAGAKLEDEIQSHSWGRIAMMSDPFGNGFCVVQFFGEGYEGM